MSDEVVAKSAMISADGRFRYRLGRVWDLSTTRLVFVMLNPSTANESVDDPTIRRCMSFARREGFGGITVVNLFAFRATDPKLMLRAIDPVGPENDRHISEACTGQKVICAWGANATPFRVRQVGKLLTGANLFSLGVTKDGSPKHPLYVRAEQPFLPFGSNATSYRSVS